MERTISMIEEKHLIRCPHCGAEYLPSEIFFPDDFLPAPDDVVRDGAGRIVACSQSALNVSEEYECDYCGRVFEAIAEVAFGSRACEIHDFGRDYSSPLYERNRVELKESDD